MLEHGGRLRRAAQRYGIPLDDWLDLSTGINPHAYPVPAVPASAWHRLPEDDDGLETAAAAYYGSAALLPVAGSQPAIQSLPSEGGSPNVPLPLCPFPPIRPHPRFRGDSDSVVCH